MVNGSIYPVPNIKNPFLGVIIIGGIPFLAIIHRLLSPPMIKRLYKTIVLLSTAFLWGFSERLGVFGCGGSDVEVRRSTSRGLSEPPLQENEVPIEIDLDNIETK